MLKSVYKLNISEGTVCNMLKKLAIKGKPIYERIKEKNLLKHLQ